MFFFRLADIIRLVSRFVLLSLVVRSLAPPIADDGPSEPAAIASSADQSSEDHSDWLQPEDPCLACQQHPSYEMMGKHYMSLPLAVMNHSRGHDCYRLEDKKGLLQLWSLQELSPSWLVNATVEGECPWQLVVRQLGDRTPSSIVELSCGQCLGHRCSRGGLFKCTEVKKAVTIWTTEGVGSHIQHHRPLQEEVTVACVCAQKHSLQGGNVGGVNE